MLGEIAHLDAAAECHRAVVWLGRSGYQLEQRRLAGAVDAHHGPALLATDHEVEPLIDAAAAVTLVDVLQADDVVARPRRRRKVERNRLAALRRLDAFDLLQLLDPALHLGSVRGAR